MYVSFGGPLCLVYSIHIFGQRDRRIRGPPLALGERDRHVWGPFFRFELRDHQFPVTKRGVSPQRKVILYVVRD